jgi:hypothetical protein
MKTRFLAVVLTLGLGATLLPGVALAAPRHARRYAPRHRHVRVHHYYRAYHGPRIYFGPRFYDDYDYSYDYDYGYGSYYRSSGPWYDDGPYPLRIHRGYSFGVSVPLVGVHFHGSRRCYRSHRRYYRHR